MEWKHEVSLEWMEARQNYLTASEIKSLIPLTKTGKPRKVTDEDYAKVFINKHRKLTRDDCLSFGAAARGHILEPYAISVFNDAQNRELVHWDDILVPNNSLGIAYSPDALDCVPCKQGVIQVHFPTYLGEVKCYGADRHISVGMTDKDDVEERWQIATAMLCSPSIDEASLILYNPSLEPEYQMFEKHYWRIELRDEIDIIIGVLENWDTWIRSNNPRVRDAIDISPARYSSEADIIRAIEKENKLNP